MPAVAVAVTIGPGELLGTGPSPAVDVPGSVELLTPVATMAAATINDAVRCRFAAPEAATVTVTCCVADEALPTTPEAVIETVIPLVVLPVEPAIAPAAVTVAVNA